MATDKDKLERTVKRLLATPPMPRKDMPKKRVKDESEKQRKGAEPSKAKAK